MTIGRIISLIFLGSMAVLVIMNPKSFATATGAVFSGVEGESRILSGSGYKH